LVGVQTVAALPFMLTRRSSFVVVFAPTEFEQRSPLVVDSLTARALELSDGTRTAAEIAGVLKSNANSIDAIVRWIENLFVCGLVRLRDPVPPSSLSENRCTRTVAPRAI